MSQTQPNSEDNFDAQRQADAIAIGEEEARNIDVESDYEASKQYSDGVSEEEAQAATSPKQNPAQVQARSQSTPDEFRKMAQDVKPNS
ncbi:MAG: hypothetical protein LRZ84_18615 [Desertifilum sp.]|nr:hypothetical protein [Desertifilum sp.]